jgi:multisubunit Na+/H+ antiporter MnhG subunit
VRGNLVVDVLLAVAVGAELVCCAGVVVARTVFDRLHFVAAASTVPPVLILAALIVREGLPSNVLSAIVAVALLLLAGPLVVHAFGRAAHRLEEAE